MSEADIRRIALELLEALDDGKVVPSFVERYPGFGWGEGYAVAAELGKLRRERGETPVGRKIGFTNRNIWPEYGATSPIWAHVYDTTLVHAAAGHAIVSLAKSVAPRIEPEIAFKLRAPVPAGCDDPAVILRSLEWLAPSCEIVDCHFADWKFKPAESAADFSFHWRLVVGTPYRFRADETGSLVEALRDCRVTLMRARIVMDRGTGANALEHPALALAFLAELLAKQPGFDALAGGEIVTTGTLTAALPVKPGETWSSVYSGLPVTGLEIKFTA